MHPPGAVSVVPVARRRRVVLVRQYRAALDAELLEIPAGMRDVAGEPPEVTAQRELIEEVGLPAGRLDPLTEFYNSPGITDEHSYVFLATDLDAVAGLSPGPRGGAHDDRAGAARPTCSALIVDRRVITDAKTIIGLLLACAHLGR